MVILLISIINSYKYGNTGVDSIVARLRANKNNEVLVRYYHNKESLEMIKEDLDKIGKCDLYGFSVFETNYLLFKNISAYIKQQNPSAIVTMGGQFVGMNYKEILKETPNVDYCILGEGETPFERLISFYSSVKSDSAEVYAGDKNIASKNDYDDKCCNVDCQINRPVVYDYFENDTAVKNSRKTYCMLTKSNVCTGNCSFCVSRKGKVIYKTPQELRDQIVYLAKNYGVRKYFLCDDDIFDIDGDVNRIRLQEFLELIENEKLNIVFSGFSKAKAVTNPLNRDLLMKMSEVGFHHLFIGVDAGNETDRLLYNKRSSLDEGIQAIRILNDLGISPRYGMIFINPFSSKETLRENYEYLVALKSSNYYHYGGLKAQLLSGTRLLKKTKEAGLLKKDFSFLNTEAYRNLNKDIEEIISFLDEEFYPTMDTLKSQYNTLKRKFELVKHLNYAQAKKYQNQMDEYEQIEVECLIEYFGHLYEDEDIEYCRRNLDSLYETIKRRTLVYKPIIKDLGEIYDNTPLYKYD